MKIQGVKRTWQPIYANLRKHYCPDCGELLVKIKISKIVNSHSLEAKNFDFQNVDNFMRGDVKFIRDEFKCPNCGRQITIPEMKLIEKEQKRNWTKN